MKNPARDYLSVEERDERQGTSRKNPFRDYLSVEERDERQGTSRKNPFRDYLSVEDIRFRLSIISFDNLIKVNSFATPGKSHTASSC
jgi:hypothetical protein